MKRQTGENKTGESGKTPDSLMVPRGERKRKQAGNRSQTGDERGELITVDTKHV